MYNRGINFKGYYQLFVKLDNGETGELTKAEYKKILFKMLAEDLEKNFLNGHIYMDGIQQIQKRDYIANLKIEYFPTCSNEPAYLYINFMHDCVVFNGLYIKY